MGDHFRRPQFGIAVWSLALVLGMLQSSQLFTVALVRPFVSAFATYLQAGRPVTWSRCPRSPSTTSGRPDAQPGQFTSTFVIPYGQ